MPINLPDQQSVGLGGSSISPHDTFSMPGIDQGAQRNADALARSLQGFGGELSGLAEQEKQKKNAADAAARAYYADSLYTSIKNGESVDVALGKIAPGQSFLNRVAIQEAAGNLQGWAVAQDILSKFPQGLTDDPVKMDAWYASQKAGIIAQYKANPAYAAGIASSLDTAFSNHRNQSLAQFAKDGHQDQSSAFVNSLRAGSQSVIPPSTPDAVRRGDTAPNGVIPFNTAGSPKPDEAAVFTKQAAYLGVSPADYTAAFVNWQAHHTETTHAAAGVDASPSAVVSLVRELYPSVHVNQTTRDANSSLGRANPSSWHIKGRAMDVRAIPGVTFNEYVQSLKDKGLNVIEAIDEYKHPSPHATGGHWHVAWGPKIDGATGATDPNDVGMQAAEFTNYLKNNGAAPGMGYADLMSLGAPKGKDGNVQVAALASDVETYNLLRTSNAVLTGNDQPELITASGKPYTGKAPDPGVHADEFPNDIITDPEVRNLRAVWMNADQHAGEGTTPQLTRNERRDLMVNESINMAIEKRDPKYLTIVPDAILTPEQRKLLVQAQEHVVNLKYTEMTRQRTESAWQMRSKAIDAMSKGQKVNPYELAKNPDGTFNYEAWDWIKRSAEEPVSEGQSKATMTVLQDDITRAAQTGNWDAVIKKYPSFAARIRPGQVPSFEDIAMAASEVAGINGKDMGGLMSGIEQSYKAGPLMQDPAFDRGYDSGIGLTVRSWVQNKMNMSQFDTPTIEADVREAYNSEIQREITAHGGSVTPAEKNAIIKAATAHARSVFDSITKNTGNPAPANPTGGKNVTKGKTSTGVEYQIEQ